ncbi:MAG TPA: hypothetical protein VGP72_11465 [Planctomycetota bacterium]|jgi:hypothetical protein
MDRAKRLVARYGWFTALAVGLLVCGLITEQVVATVGAKGKTMSLKGIVTDGQGRPIVGAKVYFVDSSMINTTPITGATVINGSAEAFDEPIEDILSNATVAKTLPQAITDKNGKYGVKSLNASATFFPFVVPDAKDTDHLPGGDVSRAAISPKAVGKGGLNIMISWSARKDATYIGSTACYGCHADKATYKQHAHALALRTTGKLSANQDLTAHPSDDEYTNQFKVADSYKGGKVLYYQEYDATQSGQEFNVLPDTPNPGPIYMKAYLWKASANLTSNGNYYLTLENTSNPKDPLSPLTMKVGLTKGAMGSTQYLLLEPPGLHGHYYGFAYKGFSGNSQGNNSYYSRAKHPYPGGITAWLNKGKDGKYGTTDDLLVVPNAVTGHDWGVSCGSCHFTGFSTYTDAVTGELLGTAIADPNGAGDLVGDGVPKEISIGCERCHGPGSMHRDDAQKRTAANTTTSKTGKKPQPNQFGGKYIVNPSLLCNDRSALICGRCHNGASITDAVNNFPLPGVSRSDFLANYVSSKGPAASTFWPDMIHNKSGHFGYPNWLSSKHSHNNRHLVACDDCHSGHYEAPYAGSLKYDAEDPASPLCQRCHPRDVAVHAKDATGNAMTGTSTACKDCHMVGTANEGAGRPGLILGTPQSTSMVANSSDANITYWEYDSRSHVMDVPSKFSVGVAGVRPDLAMPTPYTSACGTCHDASKLQYQGSH